MEGYHGGPNMGENLADVLNGLEDVEEEPEEEAENYIDPEQAVVTKVKRWVHIIFGEVFTYDELGI